MTKNQKYLLGGATALIVVASTAAASTYLTQEAMAPQTKSITVAQNDTAAPPVHHAVHHTKAAAQPAPCDDHNVVGTVGGALAGGVVGHQFGKGGGKTLTTIGGAAGGAALGNEYIPTRGVACK